MWDKSEDNFAEMARNMSNTFAENLAYGAAEKIDQEILDLFNEVSTVSNSTAVTDSILSSQKLDEYVKKLEEKAELKKYYEVNEDLRKKGYPEFQKILDYFLDNHPEYKL